MRNFNVAVKEWDDQVVFLHQIVPGAADKSYGIHVAQLAGVPRPSTNGPAKCLQLLESQHQSADGVAATRSQFDRPKSLPRHRTATPPMRRKWQLTLFGYEEHPLLEEIRAAESRRSRADEALDLIHAWQEQLATGPSTAKR